ncbi:MAG: hypothetical protein EB120_09705, partial [Proteobacteria bacterium]|nr:hypothetical protein [Pseudomonadota bacterium]
MKILFLVSLLFLMLPKASWAKEILETGTSVSHVYDARTVFTNPAGLAYQRELNGSHFSSSLSWALKDSANDLAVGLGYGAWGLGIETFLSGTGNRQRYSLGSSLSLSPWFFLGTRLAFTSSGPNLDGITQIDLGLQVRPSPFFSFGLLANRLNQPFQNGAQLSQQYTLGLTIQPLKRLLIVADFETSSDSFGKAWNYQSSVQFELLQDLFLSAGYDKEAEAHFGIQWDFGRTSLSSFARPESSQKTAVAHAQFSTLPNPSAQSATTALKVKIDSDLSEEGESSSIFASGQESFSELLLKIDRTADNPQLRSIFVDLESFPLGMGAATELNAALSKARNRGKIIHVALGNANLKEYLIAT